MVGLRFGTGTGGEIPPPASAPGAARPAGTPPPLPQAATGSTPAAGRSLGPAGTLLYKLRRRGGLHLVAPLDIVVVCGVVGCLVSWVLVARFLFRISLVYK